MDKLDKFQYTETLSTNTLSKLVHVLGTIDGEPCILSVSAQIPSVPLEIDSRHILEKNDVYSWGLATTIGKLPESPHVKVDAIFPATQTHIDKYRTQPVRSVVETPEIYAEVVKPFIETMRGSRLDWVKAILHDGAEADQVLFKDTEFLLLPNQRWDRQTLETLYLMVLFYDESLASIRDLTTDHIPLLERVQAQVLKICSEKWGLAPHQLKLYFHYHPSYYQLHIHVAHVSLQQLDFGRSILVDNVLDMIDARGDLSKSTISYLIGEEHKLAKLLAKEGK